MRSGWVLAALAACSGAQGRANREMQPFNCRDRIASYVATGHISGDELGVQMDCAEAGPRVKRWRTDRQGKREEDQHPITPAEFDRAWKEIDGTGWENLRDCGNGSLEKRDPVYQFDIKDDQNQASFSCQTREVPYPYNDITDALDLTAQRNSKQLGDDEPSDAKALDQKDKQK
ncbi:MAG TPA: hypothetical protein VL326_30310 [Kofleriaceae bacterium]|jgi:hypothetical protein|nr:hypothetical protein [Kofleriaceae bacterium]